MISVKPLTKAIQGSGTPPANKQSAKGPRPKHVAIRTCSVCRDQGAKRALTRIVRQTDGSVVLDPGGRLNGRGAYLCEKVSCWQKAAATDVLAKALNVELSQEFREVLRQFNPTDVAQDASRVSNET